MKRDLIAEVIARRSRQLKRLRRFEQTARRLHDLQDAYYSLEGEVSISGRHKRELHRHFPVALIAITEGYCKMLYRDLIDFGEPFLANARQFKDIRLDIGILIATHQRTVTIGEIIAHQLSHNGLGDIESNLSIILGQDFRAQFDKRIEKEDLALGTPVFRKHLRSYIVHTFQQRHIYCHELAIALHPRRRDAGFFIKVFIAFIILIEEHIADAGCQT